MTNESSKYELAYENVSFVVNRDICSSSLFHVSQDFCRFVDVSLLLLEG